MVNSLLMGGGRKPYLDCLRGLAMLFVVNNHICQFGLDLWWNDSVIMQVTGAVQLPLFFFISGLLAYKERAAFPFKRGIRSIANKGWMLLIPTIAFSIIYPLLYAGTSIGELPQYLYLKFPGRYWFTVSLFEIFILYYGILTLTSYTKRDFILPVFSIAAILLFLFKSRFDSYWFADKLVIHNTGIYIIYFVMGLWSRKYFKRFITLISQSWVQGLAILLATVAIWLYYGNAPHMPKLVTSACYQFAGVPLTAVIFNLFYRTASFWASDGAVPRVANLIGRRTLDIYMIHYLFIPVVISIGPMIAECRMLTIQFIVMLIVTGANITLTLAVSSLLRSNRILAKYLLGVTNS